LRATTAAAGTETSVADTGLALLAMPRDAARRFGTDVTTPASFFPCDVAAFLDFEAPAATGAALAGAGSGSPGKPVERAERISENAPALAAPVVSPVTAELRPCHYAPSYMTTA